MSCVKCHMSRVTCHIFFWGGEKVLKLVGGASVNNGATPSSLSHKYMHNSFLFKSQIKAVSVKTNLN